MMMMQAADSGHRYDPTAAALILLYLTKSRRSLGERKMSPVLVVQAGYKTPIKPVIAKFITVGIPGTDSRCTFKSKRAAEAVWYCAACKAN
jgi:hypothetical protein